MYFENIDLDKLILRCYPDPVLRQPARPLTPDEISKNLIHLSERMIELMVKSAGIGLAAPQIGLPIRLIVVSVTGKIDDAFALINPELSNFQGVSEMEEGCLSVPGVHGKVKRSQVCQAKGLDLDGNELVIEAADLSATVLQHETDHLNATLFIDRLSTLGRFAARKGIKALENDYASQKRI
ncbi:MAG: peptide deformylase [Sedimentisphaerales bacterium]|nr:peptide deformylase [Sedimentisphaerales bacterium]